MQHAAFRYMHSSCCAQETCKNNRPALVSIFISKAFCIAYAEQLPLGRACILTGISGALAYSGVRFFFHKISARPILCRYF